MSDRKPDVSKPSLRTLSFILRNRALWPAGFTWNFKYGHTCAIGLASKMWPKRLAVPNLVEFAEAFGIDQYRASVVFTAGSNDALNPVSPEMVADRIDDYLERV